MKGDGAGLTVSSNNTLEIIKKFVCVADNRDKVERLIGRNCGVNYPNPQHLKEEDANWIVCKFNESCTRCNEADRGCLVGIGQCFNSQRRR